RKVFFSWMANSCSRPVAVVTGLGDTPAMVKQRHRLNWGGEAFDQQYSACRDHYLRTPFVVDYAKCRVCGLVQQQAVPMDVAPFYRAYPVHARKSFLHRLMRKIVLGSIYLDTAGWPAGSAVLDYGCGDGGY